MKLKLVLALVVVSLLAMACQPIMPEMEDSMSDLAGTSWALAELGGEALPEGVTVTATFGEDGTLSGSGGCNRYNTTYVVAGTSLTISPQIAATMMMCPDAQMQVEQAYFAALAEVESFDMTADALVLTNAGGEPVMAFTAESQGLAGTSWIVTSYNNGNQGVVSVVADTELTATFDAEGNVSGSAGCNNYTGSYQTDGDQISIGPLAMTMMMCPDEAVMQQETQFLAALESAATYQVEGAELRMRTADDAMAVNFMAAQ